MSLETLALIWTPVAVLYLIVRAVLCVRLLHRHYAIVRRDQLITASVNEDEQLYFTCSGKTLADIKKTQQLVDSALGRNVA